MARSISAALVTMALLLPNPAAAQFGSILGDAVRGAAKPTKTAKPAADTTANKGCTAAGKTSRGANMLGSVLGGAASRTVGRVGVGGVGFYLPIPAVSGILTDAFACKLEPKEQQQAADATVKATRSGQVGASSAWTSDARPGVTGTSTVAGKEKLADGTSCMSVRDVAIVNGEETTVSKRMCRKPGASGYTLAA